MQPIKFRAWSRILKKMLYIDRRSSISILMDKPVLTFPINESVSSISVGEYYLMQYIGIKDCNEKEIYESDIVYIKKYNILAIVEWCNSSLSYELRNIHTDIIMQDRLRDCHSLDITVVGDIYNNSEIFIATLEH